MKDGNNNSLINKGDQLKCVMDKQLIQTKIYRMKNLIKILSVIMVVCLIAISCKDDDEPADLAIATLTAGTSDLNGATSSTDVAANSPITATFSTNIDASTATDANVTLVRTYDGSSVPKTISVTDNTITITPTTNFFEGDQYKVGFTGGLKSSGGKSLAAFDRTFSTKGIGIGTAPQASSQILYVQFNNSIIDLTGKATVASQQVAFTSDRFGNANSAANFRGATAAGNGDLVELTGNTFISPSMSLSVWFYINQADYVSPGNKPLLGLAGNNGYMFEIGDGPNSPNWLKWTTNHKVNPDPKAHVYATSWGDFSTTTDNKEVNSLTKTGWHQLVLTFDANTYTKSYYLDGVKIKELNLLDVTNNEWNLKDMMLNDLPGVDKNLALGYFAGKANTNPDWAVYSKATSTFKGYMDDLRIFNKSLSASEVTTLYAAEKP